MSYPMSTIALSAHNAIAALGPMRAEEIADFLAAQWESIAVEDIASACTELVRRGHVTVDSEGAYDTVLRNAEGKRLPVRVRNRDVNSQDFGWWSAK